MRFGYQDVPLRHDQHDRLAGGDHASDCVNGKLVHAALLRRADFNLLEQVLGGNAPLLKLGDFALDFAQFLRDLTTQILVDLQNLKLGFGDLALGLRH